ncbi:MAG: thioredoxin reductase, thioredoxin reductase (NADPH) [Candidatus Gottesmanbacteria bacterium GW2011_GWA2_43_14]|uniref:Thioredoxin reductase, thioredoxin reductase (NADPH) n=1 Tax=Candidatus Gottesmanbacteria bacterium GW2011_GWA2_43_14 TaxID=1618443 RepID=A0A0G1DJI3_9BACT|nr:MAG: thioredoxin reductase, thioredoxin reductase (NADPH) [Candidatus Gottesmanbacteria bacterium GW2011_GWA2_43_14]
MDNLYDLIIVGAGPAGLTASIYASCYHLKHLVTSSNLGGQLQFAPDILNYPGYLHISGKELTNKMADQATQRGGEILLDSVISINTGNLTVDSQDLPGFEVIISSEKKYKARSIIIATGTERKKLNIPGEVEYTAHGVHYCATCEKQDYKGKVCAVIGGANSAVQAAVQLADAAGKVFVIYRGDQLRGDPIWLEQIGQNSKIEVIFNTQVLEILGDGKQVTGLKLKSIKGPESTVLATDRVFIEIGGVPGTALVIPIGVKMDKGGYIIVNDKLATNIEGVFAAGDLVSYGLSIEQISSAVGLGARAAASAFAFLKKENAPTLWGQSQIKR